MVLTRSMGTTNNFQGDKSLRFTELERQVLTLMAAVEHLTKQNHDLEEQLRQRQDTTFKRKTKKTVPNKGNKRG